MTLSTSELDSLRVHLNFGAILVGAVPYTPDGFWQLFEQVISPYLSTGTETTSTTATTAGAVTAITVADASGFSAYDHAVIDVGDNAEIVQLQATTTGATETLTAKFAIAHSASGYPVATMSGKARLRMLLHDADVAYRALTGQSVGSVAGLKSVDKEDVVWQDGAGGNVLDGRLDHYKMIQAKIADLVQVWPRTSVADSGGSVRVEAY
jgi:hypothetical protein